MKAQFWTKYRLSVLKQHVPKKAVAWYSRWVSAFEKALPDVPLNERSKENVQAYVDALGKRNQYEECSWNRLMTLYVSFSENILLRPGQSHGR